MTQKTQNILWGMAGGFGVTAALLIAYKFLYRDPILLILVKPDGSYDYFANKSTLYAKVKSSVPELSADAVKNLVSQGISIANKRKAGVDQVDLGGGWGVYMIFSNVHHKALK